MKNTASKSMPTDEGWTMIIQPQRSWLDLRLGELWHYRDLVMLFDWGEVNFHVSDKSNWVCSGRKKP